MRGTSVVLAAICAAALAGCASAPAVNAPLAFVDSHTHLMTENLAPDEEIALLKKVGLSGVVLMSPQPDLLAELTKKYPGFVIPSLSLARTAATKGVPLDEKTAPLMATLYGERAVCSFGELTGRAATEAETERLKGEIYAVANKMSAPVISHIDITTPEIAASIEAAATANPNMKLILAHLGWTAGPDVIGRLLDAHPNIYTDVSIRFDAPGSLPWRNNGLDLSILAPDGSIPPAWLTLMERHPDRFLFAMDINSFGPRYTIAEDLMITARKALAPLPRPLQEAIAHGNIERILGGCGRA